MDTPEHVEAEGKFSGYSNYGKPKVEFLKELAAKTDEELLKSAELHIWLSAYAANNVKSDYHWQADACYAEANRRGKPEIYDKAFKQVSSS